jgi:acyl transferase domain-containing protein
MDSSETLNQLDNSGIAIIGMAGRFPGANNLKQFWHNLRHGVESISRFTDEELLKSGVPQSLLSEPGYVKAGGVLESEEMFDAAFFGYSPREAEMMDPQQRIFLESAWEAMEDAGYDGERYPGLVGVFAGATMSSYLLNIYSNPDKLEGEGAGSYIGIGNDLAFLAARVCYKLNLKGPSYPVQTACSTSLVATHIACQSLLNYDCDMALAGGVSIRIPQKNGYRYQEEGILSPDGRCRAFDAQAQGTIFGRGVGVVVLKRLSDALRDRDSIYAVIKGSAINNDGSMKASFTAPSIKGQANVVLDALAHAEVEADTISYIETHGSGTQLGDSIEMSALTKAFRASTDKQQFCAIGSVKTNIGHLDAAAGVTGLIKTVLSLYHKQLPPSLHFNQPNPDIDFASSPFFVNSTLREWESNSHPRRAGVSSFGFGGTNAHLVLEEAPSTSANADNRRAQQLLVLSAKSEAALNESTRNLASHLRNNPEQSLADLAYTLQVGRRPFPFRRALVCESREDAITALESGNSRHLFTSQSTSTSPRIAFLFSGQGNQYSGMGEGLYRSEELYRQIVDKCSELLLTITGRDIRELLYADETHRERANDELSQTRWAQPALFITEYALSQLLMSWGIKPSALLGHSIGEYVSAVISRVMSLEDAIRLVARRAELMQAARPGAMLAVALTEEEAEQYAGQGVSVAAVNGISRSVLSGEIEVIDGLEEELKERGILVKRLQTSHAFHSEMMEEVAQAFGEEIKRVRLNEPQIEMVGVSGKWLTSSEAVDSRYWSKQIRERVRYGAGVEQLIDKGIEVLIEVGPGRSLASGAQEVIRARGKAEGKAEVLIVSSMPGREEINGSQSSSRSNREGERITEAIGKVWARGVEVEWEKYHEGEKRGRVSGPGYAFQRERYWVDAAPLAKRQALANARQIMHPLLEQCVLETIDQDIFLTEFSASKHWVISDHKIAGHYVIPGTTYLEMAREAGSRYLKEEINCLKNIEFHTPLVVSGDEVKHVQTIITERQSDIEFKIVSRSGKELDQRNQLWTLHARGSVLNEKSDSPVKYDLSELERICEREIEIDSTHRNHQVMEFGLRWHNVKRVRVGEDQAIAYLELPEDCSGDTDQYVLHPAMLDMATSFVGAGPGNFYLPLGYEELRVYGAIPNKCYSYIRGKYEEQKNREVRRVDVSILDTEGNLVLDIKGFAQKRVHKPKAKIQELAGQSSVYQEIRWQKSELPAVRESAGPQSLLVFTSDDERAVDLVRSLRSAERRIITVRLGHEYRQIDEDSFVIQPEQCDYERLLGDVAGVKVDKILHLSSIMSGALEEFGDLEAEQQRGVYSLFALMKALWTSGLTSEIELYLVAENASAVTGKEESIRPSGAALFGLGKVLSQEHEEVKVKAIEVDDATGFERLIEELEIGLDRPHVAYRNGERYLPELRELRTQSLPEARVSIKDEGVYLITGGTGGVGLEMARYLVSKNSCVKLALLNRSQLPPREQWDAALLNEWADGRKIRIIRELEAQGAEINCYQVNISRPTDVEPLMEELRRRYGKINGVIHAAGVAGNGFTVKKELDAFKEVMSAKVAGTWVLDHATRNDAPDFFVLCSSTAALAGAPGQGDYTAANMYLDSFAASRSLRGQRTVSINWTAWRETGMAVAHQVEFDRGLFRSISTGQAIEAFDEVLNSSVTNVVVGEINYELAGALDQGRMEKLLERLPFLLSEGLLAGFTERLGSAERAAAEANNASGLPVVRLSGREDGEYTEAERRVAAIWAKELGLKEVGVFDNFYQLGGDSLVALKISNSIEKYLRQKTRISDLFEHLTVAELARHLSRQSAAQKQEEAVAPAGHETAEFALSRPQLALWFLQKIEPQSNIFNLPNWFFFEQELELDKLRAAIETLVRRHASLRTIFGEAGAAIKQTVLADSKIELDFVDLSGETDAVALVQRLITEDNRLAFDLSRPLMRARAFKLGPAHYCIYLNFHHLIADGWSVNIFLKELKAVYQSLVEGKAVELAPLELSYSDYVEEQNRWLKSDECREMESYWLEELAGPLPKLNWPLPKQSAPAQGGAHDAITVKLDPEMSARLKKAAHESSATLNTFLLAVYLIALKQITGAEDLIVGVPFSGRDRKELEGLMGLFVNTVCLRSRLEGSMTFQQLLGELARKSLSAYNHSRYPFDMLAEKVGSERRQGKNPLFSTLFQFSEFMPPAYQIPQLDLAMAGKEKHDEIEFRLSFNPASLDKETANRIAAFFMQLINFVTESPERALAELQQMLSRSEKTRQLARAKEREAMNFKRLGTANRQAVRLRTGAVARPSAASGMDHPLPEASSDEPRQSTQS